MKAFRMRRAAREDVRVAARYYERQKLGLGQRYVAAIVATLTQIEEMPESFPVVVSPNVRRGLARRPFHKHVIYFRSTARAITVLAVLHGARDPRAWRVRV